VVDVWRAAGAANVFYALGEEDGIGFSPFGIDDEMDRKGDLATSYGVLEKLIPLITQHQSDRSVHGFVVDKSHPSVDFTMRGYTLHVTLDEIFGIFGRHSEAGYGLIIATGPDEFLGAGKGLKVNFTPRAAGMQVGIAVVDEGIFEDGKWVAGRRLNGDEDDEGKGWGFDSKQVRTETVKLYRLE